MTSQEEDCEKETGTCTCATDLCNESKDQAIMTTTASATTTDVGSTSTLPSEDLCIVPGEVHGVLYGVIPSSKYNSCLYECRSIDECQWFTQYYEENICVMFETMSEINDDNCTSCISGERIVFYSAWK